MATNVDKRGLVGSGLGMVLRNKRYLIWFWVLNLALSWIGTSPFRENAHTMLDHRIYSDQLVHGFHIATLIEFFSRPESGASVAMSSQAVALSMLFFVLTALFLPGVFAGYSSTYRLPRDDFFRACGRNLWRFIRILIISGILMGIVAGILFGINGAISKKAAESTNELLPVELQITGLAIIFLVMTTLRIWFDLAETDTVLNDQRAVRRSIATAFRHTFRSLGRLLAGYLVTTIVAAIILLGGICIWLRAVPAESVAGAFVVSQLTLLLLLIPRFWQRGVAVSYWQQYMLVPVVAVQPIQPAPVVAPVEPMLPPITPEPAPATPSAMPEGSGS